MKLQRNFKNAFFTMIVLYITASFLSITLLEKAFPNVPGELRSHVRIEQSIQRILSTLIVWDESTADQRISSALAELKVLRRLSPSEKEASQWNSLETLLPRAIRGDQSALTQTMETLQNISQNRLQNAEAFGDKMKQTTLGTAWTLVLFALLGLSTTTILMFRFKRNVLDPFCDVILLLHDWKRGNKHRRYNLHILEKELRDSMETLNEVLDQNQASRPGRSRF